MYDEREDFGAPDGGKIEERGEEREVEKAKRQDESGREFIVSRESDKRISFRDEEREKPGYEREGCHFMEKKSEEKNDSGDVEIKLFSRKKGMDRKEYRYDEERVEYRLWDRECRIEEEGGVDEWNEEDDELLDESWKSTSDEYRRHKRGKRKEWDEVFEESVEVDAG